MVTTHSSLVISTYSSMLTNDSQTFHHQDYWLSKDTYYEVIQVNVFVEDTYRFTSESSFNTYGYIYKYSFDPSNLKWNLIWENDDGGGNEQFKLIVSLRPDVTYFLIVTTSSGVMSMGEFSIAASGSVLVKFKGVTQGSTIAGGNGKGSQSNQLDDPRSLSYDLYVADAGNHRVQRFDIIRNA